MVTAKHKSCIILLKQCSVLITSDPNRVCGLVFYSVFIKGMRLEFASSDASHDLIYSELDICYKTLTFSTNKYLYTNSHLVGFFFSEEIITMQFIWGCDQFVVAGAPLPHCSLAYAQCLG